MTREAFIRKWLANKNFQYSEEGRVEMREDLDKVIDYHITEQKGSAFDCTKYNCAQGVYCGCDIPNRGNLCYRCSKLISDDRATNITIRY